MTSSRNIQLIEKPQFGNKKKGRTAKAHKKQFSQNLPRKSPSKEEGQKQVATPKTIAYNKHSEKSSVDIRVQKSLNQIPSELNNFEIGTNESTTYKDSETENFFMKYSADQKKYKKRLQEDKMLLKKKDTARKVVLREEETQSDRSNNATVGLISKIREELSSEKGKEFKKILMQVMSGYKEEARVREKGKSPQGRKVFNYQDQEGRGREGEREREKEREAVQNIYKKKHVGSNGKGDSNLYKLISEEKVEKKEKRSSGVKFEYQQSTNVRTSEQNQVEDKAEKASRFAKQSHFQVVTSEDRSDPKNSIFSEMTSSKRKTFQNIRNLKIFNSSQENSLRRRRTENGEEEVPNPKDFNTDETAKILQGMCFKKVETSDSEKKEKDLTRTQQNNVVKEEGRQSEEDVDEDLFAQKKHRVSTDRPVRSSQEFPFGKKLISEREVVQNSIQSIQKNFNKNSKEKNGEDSCFPFSRKQIESNKKILSVDSQNNLRESLHLQDEDLLLEIKRSTQMDNDFDGLFGRKTKDNLSLSMGPSDRLIHKNSFKHFNMKFQGESERESNFNSLANQSQAQGDCFGLAKEMQLTKEKKMNAANGDKLNLNFELSSKNSISNSNFDFRTNDREINLKGIKELMRQASNKTNSKEASSKLLWEDSLKESRRNLSQNLLGREFTKGSNDFLFDEELDEAVPNRREIKTSGLMESFKDLTERPFDNRNIPTQMHSDEKKEEVLRESQVSAKKKKSVTTVKNYHNLASSKMYSSPEPRKKGDSQRVSTFKEVPTLLGSSEKPHFEKKDKEREKWKKELQNQENFIAELKTKNSNLKRLMEQQKKVSSQNEELAKKKNKENLKKTKLFEKMKKILEDFRGRLQETVVSQKKTLQTTPSHFSFVEENNRQFVTNAFNYEKILVKKLKELSELQEKEGRTMRELEEKKNENINLQDKIQVHKNRTDTQAAEIRKLNDKIKDYERIVENLEHELNNKEMKLHRKTRKYRNEIARARKCGNCSQRSMRKIKGKGSEILLNDLNQIKEESLSNYSETDSDDQEVNLNDYQEILDSRNEIQGRYNELMAKYLDCRSKKKKYQLRFKVLADKNNKYRKILKEVTKKPKI